MASSNLPGLTRVESHDGAGPLKGYIAKRASENTGLPKIDATLLEEDASGREVVVGSEDYAGRKKSGSEVSPVETPPAKASKARAPRRAPKPKGPAFPPRDTSPLFKLTVQTDLIGRLVFDCHDVTLEDRYVVLSYHRSANSNTFNPKAGSSVDIEILNTKTDELTELSVKSLGLSFALERDNLLLVLLEVED